MRAAHVAAPNCEEVIKILTGPSVMDWPFQTAQRTLLLRAYDIEYPQKVLIARKFPLGCCMSSAVFDCAIYAARSGALQNAFE